MSVGFVVSQVLLWVAVLVLSGLVLALLRQIGILHERIAPAGAMLGSEKPRVGERAPVYELRGWRDEAVRIGGLDAAGCRTLVLFVSATCPVCKEILPVARRMRDAEAESLRLVLASDGPRDEHTEFVARSELDRETLVLSEELGRGYQVARLPHAVLLDSEGVVRARGLVNSREHLESLFEAAERGVASIQELAEKEAQTEKASGRQVA